MKNKVQVVFVFVYILLFFLIYQNFIEQDESNLHNLFGGIEKYERGGLVFNQSIDQTQISDIIDKSIELSKKENIATIVTTVVKDSMGNKLSLDYYVAGNDEYIKSFIPNGISVPDNFSDSSSYFTTRDDDNPNAIHIFSYYKEMSISIRPLSMLEGKDDFVFTELDYYYDEVPNALSLVQEAYSGYNFTHMEIGSFQFDKDTAIKDLFIYYSVIVFILSLLYIFFKISDSSKEIMIYKLQGYSNFRIIGSIFKSEIVLNILSVILIPIIGTLIVFRGSNFRMIELLVYSFAYLGLMLIVIMLCIIMGLVFVSNQRMSDLLKNKNYNRALTTIIFLLAIVVSVTILPKIEEPFRNLVQMLNMKNKVDKHADMARKYNELGINLVKDRSFEVDHFALMGGIEDPVYEKHKKI